MTKGTQMAYRKSGRSKGGNRVKGVEDRSLALRPEDVGLNWFSFVPDKVQVTEVRRYSFREIKAFALNGPSSKLAQLLVVLFDYGDPQMALEAYHEVGKGFESDVPRVPNVGEESVIYGLDLQPLVRMKVAAFRKGTWMVMFTLWLFQDYDLDDGWLKNIMMKQLNVIEDKAAES